MQKKNPVIKNYIISSNKRILKDESFSTKITFDNLKYHVPLKQNKDLFFLFLSKI